MSQKSNELEINVTFRTSQPSSDKVISIETEPLLKALFSHYSLQENRDFGTTKHKWQSLEYDHRSRILMRDVATLASLDPDTHQISPGNIQALHHYGWYRDGTQKATDNWLVIKISGKWFIGLEKAGQFVWMNQRDHEASISPDGSIIYNGEVCKPYTPGWPWPLFAPGPYTGVGRLNHTLEEVDARPLFSLRNSEHPVRCHGAALYDDLTKTRDAILWQAFRSVTHLTGC